MVWFWRFFLGSGVEVAFDFVFILAFNAALVYCDPVTSHHPELLRATPAKSETSS